MTHVIDGPHGTGQPVGDELPTAQLPAPAQRDDSRPADPARSGTITVPQPRSAPAGSPEPVPAPAVQPAAPAPPAAGPVLPVPPRDDEKYRYVRRGAWILTLASVASFPLLLFSQTRLMLEYHWFWFYVPFVIM